MTSSSAQRVPRRNATQQSGSRRWLWLGVGLFALLILIRPPAALLGTLINSGPVSLEATEGTLWHGTGELWVRQQPAGNVEWVWLPAALLSGELGVDLRLFSAGMDVHGRIYLGLRERRVEHLSGNLDEETLARLLRPYDLAVNGRLQLAELAARFGPSGYQQASGDIQWTGGLLAYRLQGRRFETQLPPLQGKLALRGNALQLAARTSPFEAPMLKLALRPDGWFEAAASRAFIELAGQPWPGTSAPADIVLEVEEKLF